MASVFKLPAVGDTMVEGEIVEWLVEVGETVDLDQPICSIETDKSVVELTTPYRGTVLALGGEPGDVIEVGRTLIVVGEPGEDVPAADVVAPDGVAADVTAEAGAETALADDAPAGADPDETALADNGPAGADPDETALADNGPAGADPDETALAEDAPAGAVGAGGTVTTRRSAPGAASTVQALSGSVKALPKARKLARERGVNLAMLAGTGPGGSITVADVEAASAVSADQGGRRERMSATRRSIARHMAQSMQIPQFTSMVEADAGRLLDTRTALAASASSRVPLDALLVALLVPVLRDHPIMNARLDGDEIEYFDRYNIGVAVDTTEGLMVPVVRNAEALSVPELSTEILRLAAAARERTVAPHELVGATATVNNVGALGVVAGTPMLPVGTSMIAAFGMARPVVHLLDGIPTEVATMTVSATFDHRIIDGGASGRFLARLKDAIESAVGS